MRHELPLSISITALAAAITLHALAPARASEEGAPASAVSGVSAPMAPAPAGSNNMAGARPAPECLPIRLGTAREYEKVIGQLTSAGRDNVVVIDTGLVCGW